ncbi:MAG TPA: [FeFe] hydrogenase H-cluster radical SAM maturase HydE [Candidatus Omnitrophota bacterium]|nr:[FeFe] hydrogenase H-cluster radical SAM maturase HydE [Candidatus Omnitrophota bacterium]
MFDLDTVLKNVYDARIPALDEVEKLLSLEKQDDVAALFSFADNVRRHYCGDGILLRGIVEFSSFCARACFYCGLNRNNRTLKRYRLNKEQALECAETIKKSGIKTIVLQSGEDDSLDAYWLSDCIREIKNKFELAVTLCVGEKSLDEYRLWKNAGADRYLLKIETTNEKLYSSLHPGMVFENRLKCLRILKDLGYQVGCGNLVGLKGQTLRDIAEDILFFKRENFDMIGIGPFIPHSKTELKDEPAGKPDLALKTLAVARIVLKDVHLPATTALGSLDEDFRLDGLKAGANVVMPNFTPMPYRKDYEIYPDKKCIDEPVGACSLCLEGMAGSIGRHLDYSVGDSLKAKAL